jgi:hypothetical protein
MDSEFDINRVNSLVSTELLPFNEINLKVNDFCDFEIKKVNNLSEELEERIKFRNLIESAYLSKVSGVESDLLNSYSHLKDLNLEHTLVFNFIYVQYFNSIIKIIEEQMLKIEGQFEHIVIYRRMQNYPTRTDALFAKNDSSLKEISKFEEMIKNELEKLVKYQKLENKLDYLDKQVQKEFLNDVESSNSKGSISGDLINDLVKKYMKDEESEESLEGYYKRKYDEEDDDSANNMSRSKSKSKISQDESEV